MIVHDVEQNTPDWKYLRAGLPTASAFKNLVKSNGDESKSLEGYALTLAAEKYSDGEIDGFEGNYHTDRGHELEDEARKDYAFNKELEVEQVGFVTDNAESIGCSPDGLVGEDGMIEIKCLKAENHLKAILYHNKHNKAPVDYYQQVQGQMMICERKWCDVVFYHPTLPLLIIRDKPNTEFQEQLNKSINIVLDRRDEIILMMENM